MGLRILLLFSLLLAAIPLLTLFAGAQGTLDPVFVALIGPQLLTESNRLLLSGVAAVAAVNVVLIAFLITAWKEPTPPLTNVKLD